MQSKNKNDGIQFSPRYWAYLLAKRHLRGTSRPEVFPITGSSGKTIEEITTGTSDALRIYNPDGLAKTLKAVGGGLGAKTGLYAMRWKRTELGKKIRRENQKLGKDYTPFNGDARKLVPVNDGIIGTITSQAISKDSLVGNYNMVRRLTPVECERLQGFEDDWTKYGVDGKNMSDSSRYKMCGNAVTTNVIEQIGEKLCLY